MKNTQLIQCRQTHAETEVRIFSTSIQSQKDIEAIAEFLDKLTGVDSWNVDLEDWEKVLRLEGIAINSAKVLELLSHHGFYCSEID